MTGKTGRTGMKRNFEAIIRPCIRSGDIRGAA